ncbi:Adenine deaminase [Desulfocicer vacuolatum DSM 3385]|uniref:Adenine deaminase n=2 Tax=Desulfocicer vacuolatum TaxID=2298 RepID=A0A1W2A4I5_9BACT|nr:Adenine deaminase [Desulfocicer vacuolatum DSM 3385]
MGIEKKIEAAAGRQKADILFINGNIINVFTGEILQESVAVKDGYICGFGDYENREVVDLKGDYMAPGFMDSHVHIESSMVTPEVFARSVLPRGTTTVVADPHEIANVLGAEGLTYMMQATENQPMNILFALPSCVPATDMETSGGRLEAPDLNPFFSNPLACALAEMMNYPGVIFKDPGVMAKLKMAQHAGKPVDGHAPGLTGKELNAYVAAGIQSDHECTTCEEALEKLRQGMHIMVREGTCARNLEALIPAITDHTWPRMMWCTDDRHPGDILAQGHVDYIIRKAISLGLDPVRAIQMGTINCARYFGIKDAGAIAPGRRADLVIFRDLKKLIIKKVYARGVLMAEQGAMAPGIAPPRPSSCPATINMDMGAIDFSIPVKGSRVRVIKAIAHQVVTDIEIMDILEEQGFAMADPSRDMAKIAVIERHTGNTGMARGFVTGMGILTGALASSVAHDSHNIIVVGMDDKDMMQAVNEVVTMGGGLSVVNAGRTLATVPLPVAGLMSQAPMDRVHREMQMAIEAAQALGSPLDDPFMTLGFLALPVIPRLKITDKGLVDVDKFKLVKLFV